MCHDLVNKYCFEKVLGIYYNQLIAEKLFYLEEKLWFKIAIPMYVIRIQLMFLFYVLKGFHVVLVENRLAIPWILYKADKRTNQGTSTSDLSLSHNSARQACNKVWSPIWEVRAQQCDFWWAYDDTKMKKQIQENT